MIPWNVERQVRHLLAKGTLTRREIAERVGIHRATVTAVARRTPPRSARGPAAEEPAAADAGSTRCPECGRLVYPPCRACRAEALARTNPRRAPPEREPPHERALRLRLRRKARRRYEQIRRPNE